MLSFSKNFHNIAVTHGVVCHSAGTITFKVYLLCTLIQKKIVKDSAFLFKKFISVF